MKEILYYVLKYGNRYYAPYQSMKAFNDGARTLDQALSDNKTLALRFGTRDLAEMMQEDERFNRPVFDRTFDPTKCKVVAIVKKAHNVH